MKFLNFGIMLNLAAILGTSGTTFGAGNAAKQNPEELAKVEVSSLYDHFAVQILNDGTVIKTSLEPSNEQNSLSMGKLGKDALSLLKAHAQKFKPRALIVTGKANSPECGARAYFAKPLNGDALQFAEAGCVSRMLDPDAMVDDYTAASVTQSLLDGFAALATSENQP